MVATTDSFGSESQPNKKFAKKVDYGGHNLSYWINVHKLSSEGINHKKLIKDGQYDYWGGFGYLWWKDVKWIQSQ